MTRDAASFYMELEELSQKHAKIVKLLDKYLKRLNVDPHNEELQELILRYTRKLRAIRNKLIRALEEGIEFNDSTNVAIREGIALLTEYMILGGLYLEREVIKRAIKLASSGKGIRLLEASKVDLMKDLDEISKLEELFQRFQEAQGV